MRIAAVALLARVLALGSRVAHWDEGRVGYWILRYAATGHYSYNPILHGPFLFDVNRVVFAVFGASDATMRAVVAAIGGLLPLTAWLLRDRLTTAETVPLAAFLAANPILLYYSRFMRNDVLVAAFAFTAFAFLVRTIDTGRRRHLYAGAFALGLAFTTKENALVYVACWAGALCLLLDWTLVRARARDESVAATFAGRMLALFRGLRPWAADVVGAALVFLAVVVFFYAPRPALWRLPACPTELPGLVATATIGSVEKFIDTWVGGHPHSYVHYLADDLHTLAAGAAALCAFAVVGFLYDRYANERLRPLVAFAGYWGTASIVIYPAITDVSAPWAMVHVVVPLAVPAAVAGGLLVSVATSALRDGDRVGTTVAVSLGVAVVAWAAYTGVGAAFLHPQSPGPLVQYGQPNGDLHAPLAEADDAVRAHRGAAGPDVLYYGAHFHTASTPSAAPNASLAEPQHWLWRLPLPWYFERMGARTASATDPAALNGTTAPVVVTTAKHYATVAARLEGYHSATYLLTATDTPTVFFVKNETANVGGAAGANATPDVAAPPTASAVPLPRSALPTATPSQRSAPVTTTTSPRAPPARLGANR